MYERDIKAMNLGQSTVTKKNRVKGKENKDDDSGPERGDAIGEPPKKLALLTR